MVDEHQDAGSMTRVIASISVHPMALLYLNYLK